MPIPGAGGADTEHPIESAAPAAAAAMPRAEAKRRARRQERLLLALVGLMALAIIADLTGELGIIPNLDWPAAEIVSLLLAAAALWHWREQVRYQHRVERALETQIAAVAKNERR
ncbi:MAG: hypothetical protein IT563_18055, partial [Alphaproteobacteria bacterium]|nr:hypothetical protein [Alphaproteobacteria bacterium]